MDELKYCRVCLVMGAKMFSLNTNSSDSIGVTYSHLAQIPVSYNAVQKLRKSYS